MEMPEPGRFRWLLAQVAPAALILAGLIAGFVLASGRVEHEPKILEHQHSLVASEALEAPVLQDSTWPLFIGYTWGWTMLQQTLQGFAAAGWPGIVIVDNSRQKEAMQNEKILRERYSISHVVETSAHLTFSQLQSTFAYLAGKYKKEWYFWAHGDALFLPNVTNPYQAAVQCVLDKKRDHPNASVFFFGYNFVHSYDYLSVLETDTVLHKVPWDPYIIHYYADCDLYGRMLVNGRTHHHCTVGPVFNMHHVLDSGAADKLWRGNLTHDQKVDLVRNFLANAKGGGEGYAWLHHAADAMSRQTEADKNGFKLHQDASNQYFFRKYGHNAPCGWAEINPDQRPKFDIPFKHLNSPGTPTRSQLARPAQAQPQQTGDGQAGTTTDRQQVQTGDGQPATTINRQQTRQPSQIDGGQAATTTDKQQSQPPQAGDGQMATTTGRQRILPPPQTGDSQMATTTGKQQSQAGAATTTDTQQILPPPETGNGEAGTTTDRQQISGLSEQLERRKRKKRPQQWSGRSGLGGTGAPSQFMQ